MLRRRFQCFHALFSLAEADQPLTPPRRGTELLLPSWEFWERDFRLRVVYANDRMRVCSTFTKMSGSVPHPDRE
jgi:hypothetical protein